MEPYSKGNSYYMVSTKNGTQKIHDSPGLHFYVTSNINTHHYDWSIQENSEPDAMCMPTKKPSDIIIVQVLVRWKVKYGSTYSEPNPPISVILINKMLPKRPYIVVIFHL